MTQLPLVARLLRRYMRTGWRGHTRATFMLARRLESLQAVPVFFQDRMPVFVDLRLEGTHEWLQGSPWPSSPIEVDEQRVLSLVIRPGDVVFDIGANIGLHTALLSRLVGPAGRVYVFEPNPQLARCVHRTVAGLGNARFHPVALSDTESEAVLYIPTDHTMASLADWTSGRSARRTVQRPCAQVTLDALRRREALPMPQVVKCDVEGAELKVFRGARETLDRPDAPVMLFEANVHNARGFGTHVAAARDFLASLTAPQFEFYEVGSGGRLEPAREGEWEHANLLAVPASALWRITVADPTAESVAMADAAGGRRAGMVVRAGNEG